MSEREWIETDGLGGFASGTVRLTRTRRYHALLLTATQPPAGRYVSINGFDAYLHTDKGRFALSEQLYAPGAVHPDGARYIERFDPDPWPHWLFRLPDGTYVAQEIFAVRGAPIVALTFRLVDAKRRARLSLRPFLSGRDYHALHHENGAFAFDPELDRKDRGLIRWRPYSSVPEITVRTNGEYRHAPDWYRRFLYSEERARGLEHVEDLATPGELEFELDAEHEAIFIARGGDGSIGDPALHRSLELSARDSIHELRTRERDRRAASSSRLHRAAEAYVVQRGRGRTIVAGYPWFTDWGRDTFISIRGLCLSTGRIDDALDILREWARLVSNGMLPNRNADDGGTPEYNAVDASLWYAVAVGALLDAMKKRARAIDPEDLKLFAGAIEEILTGYARGTRYRIHLDGDGLIAAGEPGVQLTWMDAKVGDWVVTPRIGKPVEIQALWINALLIAGRFSDRWRETAARAGASFEHRFWNPKNGALHDVVDADHHPGQVDSSFRPNQIFAVGGLPHALMSGARARSIVDRVEEELWTPIGLRSLSPEDRRYAPRYEGGVRERDGAYHQGTVWPWLAGPFVEAWVRVRGNTEEAKTAARAKFLAPLLARVDAAGLGHLPEIADAEPPHEPRGCPFQAWSLAEAIRLDEDVLTRP